MLYQRLLRGLRRAKRPRFQERGHNNFPIDITIEYSTTGTAGGYMTDSAPESAHQPA